jgi:hypothetical protein
MPKSASAATATRAAPARAGSAAVARTGYGATRSAVPAKQIDPAVRRAVQQDGSVPLTVMVKLDTKRSSFGKFPVTNRAGSARERAFTQEVDAEVQAALPSGQRYRIVSTAANLGVATVEASVSTVRDLMRSGKVAGMKLKTG